MVKQQLEGLIKDKSAVVGVIGLGYVGLPLIVEFALKGFRGVGFEVDENKVKEINAGRSYIPDVPSENVESAVKAGKLSATTDFSCLSECDVIIVCVPTPLRKTKDPDMSFILSAGEQIKKYKRPGPAGDTRVDHLSGNDRRSPAADDRRRRSRSSIRIFCSRSRPSVSTPAILSFKRTTFQRWSAAFQKTRPRSAAMLVRPDRERGPCRYRRPASPRRASYGRTHFARSTSAWRTRWRRFATLSASTPGRSSVRRRQSRSALCRSIPGRASAATASRSTRIILSWKARQHGFDSQFITLAEQINSSMPKYVVETRSRRAQRTGKVRKGFKDPDPRRRLQKRHRRHARIAGTVGHRPAAFTRGRCDVSRSVRQRSNVRPRLHDR